MKRAKEDYFFALPVNRDDVAMVLLETSRDVYINEAAREKLKIELFDHLLNDTQSPGSHRLDAVRQFILNRRWINHR